ncbi:MAG: PQQ-binding-like beta-propeller repeat protein [Bryobacteraceae bacterium]
MKLLRVLLCGCLTLSAAEPVDNWPQWRGPHLNGSSATAKNLPVRWSPTENVAWRLEMPSWSAATPIVWEDTVFITSAEKGFTNPRSAAPGGPPQRLRGEAFENDKLILIAVNRKDGSIRWSRVIGGGNRIHRKQNFSSPSPVTDGSRVWWMTGTGILSCFDFAGKLIWQRDIQKDYGRFGLNHGYASTPLLHGDRLYVQVVHGMTTDEPSYVFAVDKGTGKTIWKVDRPTEAQYESPDNYGTPVLARAAGKLQIVVSGADWATGHDIDSGKELWRMGGFNPNNERAYRTIASSLVVDDLVFTSSTRGRPFIAFRPGGSGVTTETHQVWKNDLGPDVPTPTSDGKRVYMVSDNGIMRSFEARTGRAIWDNRRIEPGTYSASPLLADGKLYMTSEDGATTVLKAGDEFEVLAINKLDSHTLASPVAVGNQIFLRTAEHLYCFSQK